MTVTPHAPVPAPAPVVDPGYTVRRRAEVIVRVVVVMLVVVHFRDVFWGDLRAYWDRAEGFSLHHLPYRDFFWEFPPLTVVALLLIPVVRTFEVFIVTFPIAMAACEYASLELLRRAYPERARLLTRWWHLVCVPLGAIAYFRLDPLAVLPACVALVAIARRRPHVAPAIVAGIAAKLWPVVFLPVLVMQRRWRAAGSTIAGTVGLLAAWWAFSPRGFRDFLRFRKGTGLQIESTFGAVVHLAGHAPGFGAGAFVVGAGGWSWVDPFGMAVVAAVVAVIVVRARTRVLDVEQFIAGTVIALMMASRLFSPQYLLWAAPFVCLVVAGGRGKRAAVLFAGATGLTLLEIWAYHPLVHGMVVLELVVVVRNVMLLVAAVDLLRGCLRGAPPVTRRREDPVLPVTLREPDFPHEVLVAAR
jgi:hypothetical protein